MSNASPGPLTLPPRRPDTADLILQTASRMMIRLCSLDIDAGELAAEIGISKALIRYHFASPPGLLRALAVRDAADMAAAVRVLLGERVTADTIDRPLAEIVRLHLARPYGPALLRYAVRSGWSDLAVAGARPVLGALREIVKQGEALGAFRRVDPLLLYGDIVGACDVLFGGDVLLAAAAADVGAAPPTHDQLRAYLVERVFVGARRPPSRDAPA